MRDLESFSESISESVEQTGGDGDLRLDDQILTVSLWKLFKQKSKTQVLNFSLYVTAALPFGLK